MKRLYDTFLQNAVVTLLGNVQIPSKIKHMPYIQCKTE